MKRWRGKGDGDRKGNLDLDLRRDDSFRGGGFVMHLLDEGGFPMQFL